MASPPFGHYALSPWREKLRLLAGGSRKGAIGRIFASSARRAAQFAHPDPFDIEIFEGQRARLYPRDNLCEKRVFARADSWDREERAKMSHIIGEHQGAGPLIFVDAGANVGMYTLFVLGEAKAAGRNVQVLAIEPDPLNRRRLTFNVEASGALEQVAIVNKALGCGEESGHLVFAGGNRGEIRLATKAELEEMGSSAGPANGAGPNGAGPNGPRPNGARQGGATKRNADEFVKVAIITLARLLEEQNIDTVDILKIDIEGGEAAVFKAFFERAERQLLPRWIILETISSTGAAALRTCLAAGYEIALQTRMNAVLKLQNTQDE